MKENAETLLNVLVQIYDNPALIMTFDPNDLSYDALRYLLLIYGPESLENAQNISKAVLAFQSILQNSDIAPTFYDITHLDKLYREFIQLYPDAESFFNTPAELNNPKVFVLRQIDLLLSGMLWSKLYSYIMENKSKEDALKMLNQLSKKLAMSVLRVPVDLTLEEKKEYFGVLLELTVRYILENKLQEDELNKLDEDERDLLYASLLTDYQDNEIEENYISILQKIFEKLPQNEETKKILEEIKEYYWENVPEKGLQKSEVLQQPEEIQLSL